MRFQIKFEFVQMFWLFLFVFSFFFLWFSIRFSRKTKIKRTRFGPQQQKATELLSLFSTVTKMLYVNFYLPQFVSYSLYFGTSYLTKLFIIYFQNFLLSTYLQQFISNQNYLKIMYNKILTRKLAKKRNKLFFFFFLFFVCLFLFWFLSTKWKAKKK